MATTIRPNSWTALDWTLLNSLPYSTSIILLLSVVSSLLLTRMLALTSTVLMAIWSQITVLPCNLLPSSGAPVWSLITLCISMTSTLRSHPLWVTGENSLSLLFPRLLSMDIMWLRHMLPMELCPLSLTNSRLLIFLLMTTRGMALTTLTPLSYSPRSAIPNQRTGMETRLNSSTEWLVNTNWTKPKCSLSTTFSPRWLTT